MKSEIENINLVLLKKKEINKKEEILKKEMKELAKEKGEQNNLLRVFLQKNVVENELAFTMITDPKSLGLSDFEVSFGVKEYIKNYSIWISQKEDERPSEISYVIKKPYELNKIKNDLSGAKRLLDAGVFLSKPLENMTISIDGDNDLFFIEIFYNENDIKTIFHYLKIKEIPALHQENFNSFDEIAEKIVKMIN